MWFWYALGSAFFAGLMTVLSKIGIKNTDSEVVTAVRTFFVLIFCVLTVFFTKSFTAFSKIPNTTFAFLYLSGISTALSWLCYFRALSNGSVNSVAAVDKTATVIAVLSAIFIFNETDRLISKLIGVSIISVGIIIMSVVAAKGIKKNKKGWLGFAFASAFFSALSSILSKFGVEEINSNLATTLRTAMVLLLAVIIVTAKGKISKIKSIPKKDTVFIFLSALSTAAGWLCFYKALSIGEASLVVPIDKLGLLVTAVFSLIILKEKLSKKEWTGIGVITVGTLLMTVKF